MLHGDEADVAAEFEERERRAALASIMAGPSEDPDEDGEGNRYCLDCGEIIPQERVKAVQAVRCVHCAGLRERGRKFERSRGSIRRYLTDMPESNAGTTEEI